MRLSTSVVRRVTVADVGNAAKFQPVDDEIRFSFRFEVLQRDAAGDVVQRGVCTLPGGRELSLTVNDEKGASTPEGDIRVFAGLRSDPFYLAWIASELKKVPNLLQHDNCSASWSSSIVDILSFQSLTSVFSHRQSHRGS
jgi:hypothetical protein